MCSKPSIHVSYSSLPNVEENALLAATARTMDLIGPLAPEMLSLLKSKVRKYLRKIMLSFAASAAIKIERLDYYLGMSCSEWQTIHDHFIPG